MAIATPAKELSPQDARELLDIVQLENIVVYEERARRRLDGAEDQDDFTNALAIAQRDRILEFRFRSVFDDSHGSYVADIAVHYGLAEVMEIDRIALLDFSQKVAFMSAYPFIRSSIFGSASRLGNPTPVLGLVRQGEFELGSELSAEDVAKIFSDNQGG